MVATQNKISDLIVASSLSKIDVKLLLRHILGLTQAQLIMQNDRELSSEEFVRFQELSSKITAGMPMNYILGYREFYSRDFLVTEDTLIPRPETELLVETALTFASPGFHVLDLGTGSGVIAITLKLEYPELKVDAVDKFEKTLSVASQNAQNLDADIRLLKSDWFSNVNGAYEIIVSNPPYISHNDPHLDNLTFEPQAALTDFNDGYACIRQIIEKAQGFLKNDGWMIVEHGFEQGEVVRDIYAQNNYSQIKTLKDYAGLDRITMGQKNA